MDNQSTTEKVKVMTREDARLVRLGICPRCQPPHDLSLVHNGECLLSQQCPKCRQVWVVMADKADYFRALR